MEGVLAFRILYNQKWASISNLWPRTNISVYYGPDNSIPYPKKRSRKGASLIFTRSHSPWRHRCSHFIYLSLPPLLFCEGASPPSPPPATPGTRRTRLARHWRWPWARQHGAVGCLTRCRCWKLRQVPGHVGHWRRRHLNIVLGSIGWICVVFYIAYHIELTFVLQNWLNIWI
jgi:hypothetical protein